jgi:hypothetical protein
MDDQPQDKQKPRKRARKGDSKERRGGRKGLEGKEGKEKGSAAHRRSGDPRHQPHSEVTP